MGTSLFQQSQSMRAKAYRSVLFSAIKTTSKPYLVMGFWREDISQVKVMLSKVSKLETSAWQSRFIARSN